jgi:hypothetical protein
MNDVVHVRDVIEKNDCAGKKHICITASEEQAYVQYRLTPAWMPPHIKLGLASVAPLDTVRVVIDPIQRGAIVIGDYVENLTDYWNRTPVCRCETLMVSDGFDVYCPNPECALTIATRLERLGTTSFFRSESMASDLTEGYFDHQGIAIFDDVNYCRPFHPITQGLFWGEPGGSLEHILLTRNVGYISLATFLVPSLFEDFLGTIKPFSPHFYTNITRFYGAMDEFVNRRDFTSVRQNQLIYEFIWSLGIESLSQENIFALTQYEKLLDQTVDPILCYAYVLTHPIEMIRELGLHHLEAAAIVQEISRRKHELFDIFYYYANNKADIQHSFSDLL